jgi:thioredoxin reductase
MELERGEYYIAGAESGTVDSEAGRTTVDGLYAAGWMTNETVQQAVVSAGHDARAPPSR